MASQKETKAWKLLKGEGHVPDAQYLTPRLLYPVIEALGYVYNRKELEWKFTNEYRLSCGHCGSNDLKYCGVLESFRDKSKTVMFKCQHCGEDVTGKTVY